MERRNLGLRVLAGGLLLGSACSEFQTADPACPAEQREFPVRVSGGLSSTGRLRLAPAQRQPGVYELILRVDGAQADAEPVMVIRGVGTCEHGVVRTRFGGGAGENASYRVLGGVVESVIAPSVIGRPFGAWNMDLLDKRTKDTLNFRGFWRATPEPTTRQKADADDEGAHRSSG